MDQSDILQSPFKSRVLIWMAGVLLGMTLAVGLAGAWIFNTAAGARLVLDSLGQYTGITFSGVSGTLAHQLHVQRMSLTGKELAFSADDVDLQWQPTMLWQRALQVDQLQISHLELALPAGDGQPVSLPQSLQLPDGIRHVNVNQLKLRQFSLATLTSDNRHTNPQLFSDLQANAALDSSMYKFALSGTTPWGSAVLQGNLGTMKPFNINARIDWQGLAVKHDNVTLPETRLNGKLAGNLSRVQFDAQLNSAVTESKPGQAMASGQVVALLTPFSPLPAEFFNVELSSVNPASFYRDAPRARLKIKAGFHVGGSAKAPVLNGHFLAVNDIPATWNLGGVPLVQLSSDVTLSEKKISWKETRIVLEQGGSASGSGDYVLPARLADGKKTPVGLPDLNAQFELSQVNLLRIDSRLKKSLLSGKVAAKTRQQVMTFTLDLHESNPAANVQLLATASLNQALTLNLETLQLSAKDATMTAQGSLALRDNLEFALQGEAHNFNPSRWIDVPDGHLATRYKLAGQLQHGWRIDAQLNELSGQFAGSDLRGVADFQARQDSALLIHKLDLSWGKNQLSAQGGWQLGSHLNPDLHEQLQVHIAVPDLADFSRPLHKFLSTRLQGSMFADGVLSGNAAQPSGHLTVKASQIAIPDLLYLDDLHADLTLADGVGGQFAGKLDLAGLSGAATSNSAAIDDKFRIISLHAELNGLRHDHRLQLTALLPQKQQLSLQLQGDLVGKKSDAESFSAWSGRISACNLTGPLDFQLQSPFTLQLSANAAQMSEASWQGKLGSLHVQKMNWSHGQLETSGQFQNIPVVRVLKFIQSGAALNGDLMLDAAWQLNIGQQVAGQVQIQRSSGDLNVFENSNGRAQTIPLGMQKFLVTAQFGLGNQSQLQQIVASLDAQGDQLGLMHADLSTYLKRTGQGWALPPDSPLKGQATLQIKDIRWMSQLLGDGINLHGELDAATRLSGTLSRPDYQAKISGHDLQVSLVELGILFPNGVLDAEVADSQFRLNSLKFTQTMKKPPQHDNLLDLPWIGATGVIESTGSIDLRTGQGAILTQWQKFPFMQGAGAWMVASGQAQIAETGKTWNLTGQLVADAAYFSVPKQAAPKLSGDVVVLKKTDRRGGEKSSGLQTNLDFSFSTGKNFIFVGRGLDTRLDGEIRLRSKNGGSILATGNIQTDGGTYEGYGQKLAIDRGILNFQGPIDNPGLNVRAIRRGLAVEAGVEVVGTVDRPEVHLISEPNVPDPDKLSWMVLGRPSDQMAGSEATLLMSAAGAIFGGDNGSNIPSTIAHSFGLDGLSFGTTSSSPGSALPVQTVAGTISATSPNDQVFSVGKRIAPNIVLSIERSLMDASNGLKLTWQLTRQFSVIGRAGSDTAIDGQYTFSFD